MASIKLKFRTSSVQEKEGRLYYQVIHNRVARQIHTEYRIYSSEWDADHSNIILPTSVTPQRQAYLLSLKDTLDADRKKLLLVIARLDKEGQSYTADTVVDNFHEGKELHGIIGYTLELNEKLRRIGKKRMVARYKTTLNSLQRYLKGGDVPLEEVDGTTIQGYEQWLKDSGLCRNTTSFYIRNLLADRMQAGGRQAGCGAELSGHKGRGKSGGNLRVLFRRHTRTAGCGHPAANIRAHYPSESERG